MPVLMLALASMVVFIGTLLLMAFANVAEEKQIKRISIIGPGTPFRVLSVCDAFEAEYAILWESQIPALRLIASEGTKGLPITRLESFYDKSVRHYPELYDGSSFQQWLIFLEEAELIAVTGDRIKITKQGLEFLRFRVPAIAA